MRQRRAGMLTAVANAIEAEGEAGARIIMRRIVKLPKSAVQRPTDRRPTTAPDQPRPRRIERCG
jgi:hypothetical protein